MLPLVDEERSRLIGKKERRKKSSKVFDKRGKVGGGEGRSTRKIVIESNGRTLLKAQPSERGRRQCDKDTGTSS